jgi:hypothetical protein
MAELEAVRKGGDGRTLDWKVNRVKPMNTPRVMILGSSQFGSAPENGYAQGLEDDDIIVECNHDTQSECCSEQ